MMRTVLLIAWIVIGPIAFGQEAAEPIVLGERFTIESQILSETRPIFVATPPSYEGNTQRYGVAYVLDAEFNFHHAVTTARFLGEFGSQSIPPLLVVGIGNTNRMRDMTPPSEAQENSLVAQGGADRFLQFIADELSPWVDERYRTNDHSLLIGHSLGGLVAIYSLVSRTASFDSYLAIDPSLNWNDQELVRRADTLLDSDLNATSSLFIASSNFDDPAAVGIRNFVDLLDTHAPKGLRWAMAPMSQETHETIPLPGVYQGLRWLFSGWNIEAEAEATFSDAPADEIFEDIDAMYRSSGAQFGTERIAPYSVFESLLAYLAESGRIDEAAALTLDYSERYPLPLVPNVISGIAQLFVQDGNEDAAREYLLAVLDLYPDNQTATQALRDLGFNLP